MYEINFIVWPLVFGVAGHVWGERFGHPLLGLLAGVSLGLMTAVPLVRALYYDVEIVAPFLLLAVLLVPRPVRPWYLAGLCVLPWVRLGLGAVKRRSASRQSA
jgi:hypothetical protein